MSSDLATLFGGRKDLDVMLSATEFEVSGGPRSLSHLVDVLVSRKPEDQKIRDAQRIVSSLTHLKSNLLFWTLFKTK